MDMSLSETQSLSCLSLAIAGGFQFRYPKPGTGLREPGRRGNGDARERRGEAEGLRWGAEEVRVGKAEAAVRRRPAWMTWTAGRVGGGLRPDTVGDGGGGGSGGRRDAGERGRRRVREP